ncbi:MAG: acylneuraminate cytidylyltransferase family protein [Agathobacter sp.]|nr:acylneuraminate cytidylyltransferase family protein [Agathobacter sp.]
MKNLAIIPARSGSKGLKDKNIKYLMGKPLMAYSIEAALNSSLFDEVMVSTDSEEYARIAMQCGAKVPFLRSEETSLDSTSSWDTVREVLSGYSERGEEFDTVCLLQPTSPLRDVDDIVEAYRLLDMKGAEAVTSVCEVDHSPLWSMILPEDGSLKEFRKSVNSRVQRQQLDSYYRLNGAIYIRKISCSENCIDLLDENEYAYIMEREKSVDIDTDFDFKIAECLLQKNKR